MTSRIAPPGMYRVIGVDKSNYEEWESGDFHDPTKAKYWAQKKTDECKRLASDESIATIYSVYNDKGGLIYRGHWR